MSERLMLRYPARFDAHPRILIGCWPVAARNPDAIVIDLSDRTIRGIRGVSHIAPAHFRILTILLLNYGRLVTYDEIFDYLWGHRADGGPEYALRSLSVRAYQIRQMIAESGLSLSTRWGVGLILGLEGQFPPIKRSVYAPRKVVAA